MPDFASFFDARSVWRRLQREHLDGAMPDEVAAGRPDRAPSGALDGRVRDAVRELPRRQREVVALRIIADLSADETGKLLGLATATVHVHLHRALGELRRVLDPGSPGGGTGGPVRRRLPTLDLAELTMTVRHAY